MTYSELKRLSVLSVITMAVWFVSGNQQVCAQDDVGAYEEKGYLSIFYPLRNATLSAEVSGTIRKFTCDMGERFKKGDVLIELNPVHLQAEKEKAEATKTYSAAVYQSKKELYNRNSVSMLEYTKAQADYHISKANLTIARKKLAACIIRAPYDGKVVRQLSRENEFVLEGQPLLEIIDDRIIRVKFHLPSHLYADIDVGRRLLVKTKNGSSDFECSVTHISPVEESNTGSFQVFAEVENPESQIRAGMTGYIIVAPSRND